MCAALGDGAIFTEELFGGKKPVESGLKGYKQVIRWTSRVRSINVNEQSISLERRLPLNIKRKNCAKCTGECKVCWQPEVHRVTPMTEGVGIEGLTIEFPFTT